MRIDQIKQGIQMSPSLDKPEPPKLKASEDLARIQQIKEALKIPLPPLPTSKYTTTSQQNSSYRTEPQGTKPVASALQLLNIDCDEQKVSYQVDMEDEEICNIRKQMNFSITGSGETAAKIIAT
jgi:hypothetical protein